jgi:hypothetical protein
MSLPSSKEGNQASYKQRNCHEWDCHRSKRVNVFALAILDANLDLSIISCSIKTFSHSNLPKTPKESRKCDQSSAGGMQHHIGFPLMPHVPCSHNLQDGEDIPCEKKCPTMSKVKT